MLTTEQILESARLTAQCGEHDCRNSSTIPRRRKPEIEGKSVSVRVVIEEDAETGERRVVQKG